MRGDLEIASLQPERQEEGDLQGAPREDSPPRINVDPPALVRSAEERSVSRENSRSDNFLVDERNSEQGETKVDPLSKTRLEPSHLVDPALGDAKSSTIESDAAGASWRAEYFTGTLGLKMGQSVKVPGILPSAHQDAAIANDGGGDRIEAAARSAVRSILSPLASEQALKRKRLASDAGGFAHVENVPASDFATFKVKSPSSKKAELRVKFFSARGLALTSALIAMFAAGLFAVFTVRESFDASRKAAMLKHALDEMAARLRSQEENLRTREAEVQKKAEELRRLADEVESKLKDADERQAAAESMAACAAEQK